jgi:hypothetical protein
MIAPTVFGELALRLAVNAQLRAQFMTAPQAALATMGIEISDGELAVLREIASKSIETSIQPFGDREVPRLSAG